jgi:hypothetical protein
VGARHHEIVSACRARSLAGKSSLSDRVQLARFPVRLGLIEP